MSRDWYAARIAEQPGAGRLHHHLGLLSREVEGEEFIILLKGILILIFLILDHR